MGSRIRILRGASTFAADAFTGFLDIQPGKFQIGMTSPQIEPGLVALQADPFDLKVGRAGLGLKKSAARFAGVVLVETAGEQRESRPAVRAGEAQRFAFRPARGGGNAHVGVSPATDMQRVAGSQ